MNTHLPRSVLLEEYHTTTFVHFGTPDKCALNNSAGGKPRFGVVAQAVKEL